MNRRLRTALAALVALALTALTASWVGTPTDALGRQAGYACAAWLLFALGVWSLRGVGTRSAVLLILLGGLAVQMVAATAPPHGSDDLYRYVWDGRVQAAGIDPYSYVPGAPQLAGLRDPGLWPDQHTAWCVSPGTADPDGPGTLTPGCTLINRPTVHTVYPPVAEAYFAAVHLASPAPGGYKSVQLAAVLVSFSVALALLLLLRRLGRGVWPVALWAWCPLVAVEEGNNAHVDVLSALLMVCALGLLARARTAKGFLGGGALLGLAVATKFDPVLALPASLRRRPVLVCGAVFSAFALTYVPHLIAVGSKVVGFLPGYLQQEGYDDGSRFALIGIVIHGKPASVIAVAVLAATALAVYRRADPDRPWRGALVLTGTALLVTTPLYPWYAIPVCALVVLDGRIEWLAVAGANFLASLTLAAGWSGTASVRFGYGAALLAVVVGARLRARHGIGADPDRTAPGVPAAASPHPVLTADLEDPVPLVDVVLPCLDEEAALPYVLGRLPQGYRAIVVDNGSTDRSAEVAAGLGALVVTEPRRGFGSACHAGLAAATAPVVCFCDCDGSMDPAQLSRVADPVLDGAADLVLGRRRPTVAGAWPPHARIANLVLAFRLRRIGVPVRDLGPMRAARREALLDLGVADRRSGYPLETVLSARRAGWRIAETDVDYAPRTGKSKVTGTVAGTVHAVRDMNRAWKQATG
jgi:Glycosyl transferase family 2/Glycosyltransferase family 87